MSAEFEGCVSPLKDKPEDSSGDVISVGAECAVPCPSLMYTTSEWDAIVRVMIVLAAVAAALSFLSFVAYFRTRRFLIKMFMSGFCLNSVVLLAFLLGNLDNRFTCTSSDAAYVKQGTFCVMQGVCTIFGFLWVECWAVCQAVHLYAAVVKRYRRDQLQRLERLYLFPCTGLPVLLTLIPLAAGNIGFDPKANIPLCLFLFSDTEAYFWAVFYAPQCVLIVCCMYLMIRSGYQIHKVLGAPDQSAAFIAATASSSTSQSPGSMPSAANARYRQTLQTLQDQQRFTESQPVSMRHDVDDNNSINTHHTNNTTYTADTNGNNNSNNNNVMNQSVTTLPYADSRDSFLADSAAAGAGTEVGTVLPIHGQSRTVHEDDASGDSDRSDAASHAAMLLQVQQQQQLQQQQQQQQLPFAGMSGAHLNYSTQMSTSQQSMPSSQLQQQQQSGLTSHGSASTGGHGLLYHDTSVWTTLWRYNKRSMLFVIVFCLSTLYLMPVLLHIYAFKYDDYQDSEDDFAACLYQAGYDPTLECGDHPDDRPNYGEFMSIMIYVGAYGTIPFIIFGLGRNPPYPLDKLSQCADWLWSRCCVPYVFCCCRSVCAPDDDDLNDGSRSAQYSTGDVGGASLLSGGGAGDAATLRRVLLDDEDSEHRNEPLFASSSGGDPGSLLSGPSASLSSNHNDASRFMSNDGAQSRDRGASDGVGLVAGDSGVSAVSDGGHVVRLTNEDGVHIHVPDGGVYGEEGFVGTAYSALGQPVVNGDEGADDEGDEDASFAGHERRSGLSDDLLIDFEGNVRMPDPNSGASHAQMPMDSHIHGQTGNWAHELRSAMNSGTHSDGSPDSRTSSRGDLLLEDPHGRLQSDDTNASDADRLTLHSDAGGYDGSNSFGDMADARDSEMRDPHWRG